ncbi:MAG TPA: AAA family ATPase [Steroidobacteraceae bacterium]|nr:AAA family ATPase [Steroidobacteraceae bacterium]
MTHAVISSARGLPAGRIVIAGGPGSGKSTLLQALAESGEICYEECSRVLIREQLAQAGRLVPWGDLSAFARECSERMRAQLADSMRHGRCFFDRGLPDLIGYLSHGGHGAPDAWRAASRAYGSVVFFAPPWREIFVNDAERPQSFVEAQELSAHIRRAYEDCGFQLVELVKSSVADRLRQLLDFLDAHQRRVDHG